MQQSWSGGRGTREETVDGALRCNALIDGSVFEVLVLVWVEEFRWSGVEFDLGRWVLWLRVFWREVRMDVALKSSVPDIVSA
jgi:hypothetical protein